MNGIQDLTEILGEYLIVTVLEEIIVLAMIAVEL